MMPTDVWFYLFWIACALFGATGVALFIVLHPAVDKEDTGNVQREYTAPSYARTAGFAIQTHPDSEILHPRRFWLVNDGTAEIEYVITPNHFARLRAAPSGTLDLPDDFLNDEYESIEEYDIDGILVTQSQSPGRNGMLRWTRDDFDFVLLADQPEMNLLGGVATDFVQQSSAGWT
ncbi:MAG TPA: hypothetical protein H9699_08910 [Candidatus Gemmiger stercoravium]|nr:hypothetical protein [Candidatus Gemmiger stercoravium]